MENTDESKSLSIHGTATSLEHRTTSCLGDTISTSYHSYIHNALIIICVDLVCLRYERVMVSLGLQSVAPLLYKLGTPPLDLIEVRQPLTVGS